MTQKATRQSNQRRPQPCAIAGGSQGSLPTTRKRESPYTDSQNQYLRRSHKIQRQSNNTSYQTSWQQASPQGSGRNSSNNRLYLPDFQEKVDSGRWQGYSPIEAPERWNARYMQEQRYAPNKDHLDWFGELSHITLPFNNDQDSIKPTSKKYTRNADVSQNHYGQNIVQQQQRQFAYTNLYL